MSGVFSYGDLSTLMQYPNGSLQWRLLTGTNGTPWPSSFVWVTPGSLLPCVLSDSGGREVLLLSCLSNPVIFSLDHMLVKPFQDTLNKLFWNEACTSIIFNLSKWIPTCKGRTTGPAPAIFQKSGRPHSHWHLARASSRLSLLLPLLFLPNPFIFQHKSPVLKQESCFSPPKNPSIYPHLFKFMLQAH